MSGDKHSSLFCRPGDEDKMFYVIALDHRRYPRETRLRGVCRGQHLPLPHRRPGTSVLKLFSAVIYEFLQSASACSWLV
jgi:hypothetical protein